MFGILGLHSSVSAEDHGNPPVEELEAQFNSLMDLETNEDGEVKKYSSKGRLEQEFKSIMVWPLADHFVDTYFEEKNGKLYKKEIDGPYRLQTDEDYSLEKINDSEYKLTQQGENQLRGSYTLTITYSYEAGKWVFADRMDHVSDQGGQMPDTATSLPTMMMFGIIISAIGLLVLTLRKRLMA
ncbi:hypothetical protein [Sediminibacillus halophilus]|uniref:Uncharacterized protein n=1 Tax=Sediminibacillus halophilus TaxID=482461 RepID=A0A1G9TS33_9BACI|nr:hypothetical protein [Sediminibacillus halophilus]SDM49985.1 hypothetical protein SAMN05216244_2685 [Sediminibacillus halophilus]